MTVVDSAKSVRRGLLWPWRERPDTTSRLDVVGLKNVVGDADMSGVVGGVVGEVVQNYKLSDGCKRKKDVSMGGAGRNKKAMAAFISEFRRTFAW